MMAALNLDSKSIELPDYVAIYAAFQYAMLYDPPFIQWKETPMNAFVLMTILSMFFISVGHQIELFLSTVTFLPEQAAARFFLKVAIDTVSMATRGYGVRFLVLTLTNDDLNGFVFIVLYKLMWDIREELKTRAISPATS